MYETRQNKEKVSHTLSPLMRKGNQQIDHATKCIKFNGKDFPKNSNPIQFVTNEFAKSKAEEYQLNYEKVVLPAIETYLRKKVLVDGMKPINLESLNEKEYMLYLVSLLTEADNRKIKRITNGIWYRGIGFAHFSYPTFRNTGILCGEGFDDEYYWTMGEESETRWLPGATIALVCTCGPLSQVKYLKQAYTIKEHSNIIGIIVRKELSKTNPALYIDNPESECGIRGPQQVELAYLVDINGELIPFSDIEQLPVPAEL